MPLPSDVELEVFYRTLAPYYDDDYVDFHHGQDIAFYSELARKSPGPVLEMGCGTAQGYYLGRPVAADRIPELVRGGNPVRAAA